MSATYRMVNLSRLIAQASILDSLLGENPLPRRPLIAGSHVAQFGAVWVSMRFCMQASLGSYLADFPHCADIHGVDTVGVQNAPTTSRPISRLAVLNAVGDGKVLMSQRANYRKKPALIAGDRFGELSFGSRPHGQAR